MKRKKKFLIGATTMVAVLVISYTDVKPMERLRK